MPRGGAHRPGNRLWLPSDLGGALVGWYDAADANSIVLNGSNVSTWRDKSGQGNHVIQATAASQPGYIAATPTVRPAVDFTVQAPSSLTAATNTFPLGAAARSIFAIYTPQSTVTTNAYLSWGLNFNGQLCSLQNFNGNNPYFGAVGNDCDSAIAFATGVRMSAGFTYSGGAMLLSKNGGANASATHTLATSAGTFYIGASAQGAGQVCQVHEVVILNIAADPVLAAKILGRLHWKWGLQALLPATHAYALAPPRFAF